MSRVENTKKRLVEGHGHHDKRSGWRRAGGVGEPEVVEGMHVITGVGLLSFEDLV